MTDFQINRLLVVGVGLIGGSVAAGLRRAGVCREILGVAHKASICEQALEVGLVDRASVDVTDFIPELSQGDLVFIAVPTLAVDQVLKDLAPLMNTDVTITDGASVKGSVARAAQALFGVVPKNLVLGHPIAGSEKSGVTAANPDLYANHRIIVTPVESNALEHITKVENLWSALGANVLQMNIDEHDEVLAATSHLPHVIAYSLVDTLAHDSENENIFRYAAGGFRDFTRIASSNPLMWHDIMRANKDAVIGALDLFEQNLSRLRTAIAEEDSEAMLGVFTRAKVARDHFTKLLTKQAYSEPMHTDDVVYIASPGKSVSGEIRVPGDKSVSHRSCLLYTSPSPRDKRQSRMPSSA